MYNFVQLGKGLIVRSLLVRSNWRRKKFVKKFINLRPLNTSALNSSLLLVYRKGRWEEGKTGEQNRCSFIHGWKMNEW